MVAGIAGCRRIRFQRRNACSGLLAWKATAEKPRSSASFAIRWVVKRKTNSEADFLGDTPAEISGRVTVLPKGRSPCSNRPHRNRAGFAGRIGFQRRIGIR